MKIRGMKSVLALSCGLLSMVTAVGAQEALNTKPEPAAHVVYFPTKDMAKRTVPTKANISYHGGPVLTTAHVVFIFWGPNFANAASSDHTYATTLQAFRNQYGTNGEYNTITQYSGIQLTNLAAGGSDWFDTSTPPTNVTDSTVRAEVNRYFSGGHGTFNNSTIYEVVTPSSSYSSNGTSTSCGGPGLAYCAYHSHFSSSGHDVKYSIQPWASCSGCTVSGWSAVQNEEHFVTHETREAVTDPDLNAWYDSSGNEADDKCAWSPTPFLSNGYGYQYEWSNANGGCVKTR
jgi:hypothetical protein